MNNRYGLDDQYFREWMKRVLDSGLEHYTPQELARELARMSKAAAPEVMHEPEFGRNEDREELHCAEVVLEAHLVAFPEAPTEFPCLGTMIEELVKQLKGASSKAGMLEKFKEWKEARIGRQALIEPLEWFSGGYQCKQQEVWDEQRTKEL